MPLQVDTAKTSVDVPHIYIAPEARVGYRLSDRIELSAGVEVMVLVALQGSALEHDERRRPR